MNTALSEYVPLQKAAVRKDLWKDVKNPPSIRIEIYPTKVLIFGCGQTENSYFVFDSLSDVFNFLVNNYKL